ncbi:MAG TPA: hypothetical protein VND62_00755 [Acidimicrobiales bacterium]|nr:hypothetical protein [Acidimicrobiales bacterium]
MTGFDGCLLVLLVGGLVPALAVGARGRPVSRLVGLELANSVVATFFVVFALVSGFTFDLMLPLVLAPMSLAGTLVYTRLLSAREGR